MTSATYVHMLFGLLLWGLVIARFRCWLKHSPPSHSAEVREFSRQLSRMVYLLLYLVIGVTQILEIVNFMRLGGTLGFDPLRDSEGGIANCQVVLVYGLSALALIRVSAYWIWRRLVL